MTCGRSNLTERRIVVWAGIVIPKSAPLSGGPEPPVNTRFLEPTRVHTRNVVDRFSRFGRAHQYFHQTVHTLQTDTYRQTNHAASIAIVCILMYAQMRRGLPNNIHCVSKHAYLVFLEYSFENGQLYYIIVGTGNPAEISHMWLCFCQPRLLYLEKLAIISLEHAQLQLDKFAKHKMEFIFSFMNKCLLWLS